MSSVLVVIVVALVYSHQRHFGLDKCMPSVQSFGHTAFVSGVNNNKFYEEINRLSLSGFHTFVINSPGGDYYAARKIVKTINRNNDKVDVDGGQCASSCVYVFAYSKNMQPYTMRMSCFTVGILGGIPHMIVFAGRFMLLASDQNSK